MRIYPPIQSADAKEMRRQGELAFTMVEIAIAIGVIGFALVAIIGILPAGMNVQKDNREDTLISQDAPYFLDAIRNGAVVSNSSGGNFVYYNSSKSLDFLNNYVQSIQFVYVVNGVNTATNTYPNREFTRLTGAEIIGLLSTPQTNYNSQFFTSNYFDTIATVRALSGPATEQNGLNNVMAFTYQMEVFISPFNSFAPLTVTPGLASDSNQAVLATYRNVEAYPNAQLPQSSLPIQPYRQAFMAAPGGLSYNLFEVRLRFSWPVLPNGGVGPGHQTYRTLIASPLLQAEVSVNEGNGRDGGILGYFFQPQVFANSPPPGL
jgi:type II secretory pathway pseudopilin PulG